MNRINGTWVLGFAIAAAACHVDREPEPPPNSEIVVELPGPFTAIEVAEHLNVTVVPGPSPQIRVREVEGKPERVIAQVDDGVLALSVDPEIRHSEATTVTIVTPSVERIACNGAAALRVDEIDGPRFQLEIDGTAGVVLGGSVDTLDIEIEGTGHVDSTALTAQTVNVEIEGSAVVNVMALEMLDVEIDGAAKVGYLGDPTVRHSISGGGVVSPQ